jgi:hypothetical protein
MRQTPRVRARANEGKYPYIVELLVADDELDVALGRRIMNFHRSRKLQARHGRRIVSEDYQMYFRWCFSDLATAHEFMEEFGGAVT